MKTIFIPDYRHTNPYQTNLSRSLSKQGIHVYFGDKILASVIQYWKPDILHIHWPRPFLTTDNKFMAVIKSTYFTCQLLLLKLFGIRIIWTVHNIADHEGKFKDLEMLFNKILARLCDRLIIHCPSVKTEVKNLYEDVQTVIIPHGNYIGWYKNDITATDARVKLGLNKEDIVFLYFGQIRSYKGVPELICSFKKLDNQKAMLLIVGKPLNDDIANDIYDSCKDDRRIKNILKFIPDEDVQIYMNAADIIVLPYKNVLTSGAIILAMSFGKAIIAPAVRCIADTLNEKGSFLYTGDELFSMMQYASNIDRTTIMNMGKYNFMLAEQLGWNEIGKRTYHVYQECVAGQANKKDR